MRKKFFYLTKYHIFLIARFDKTIYKFPAGTELVASGLINPQSLSWGMEPGLN